jgi:hypothetical protein
MRWISCCTAIDKGGPEPAIRLVNANILIPYSIVLFPALFASSLPVRNAHLPMSICNVSVLPHPVVFQSAVVLRDLPSSFLIRQHRRHSPRQRSLHTRKSSLTPIKMSCLVCADCGVHTPRFTSRTRAGMFVLCCSWHNNFLPNQGPPENGPL